MTPPPVKGASEPVLKWEPLSPDLVPLFPLTDSKLSLRLPLFKLSPDPLFGSTPTWRSNNLWTLRSPLLAQLGNPNPSPAGSPVNAATPAAAPAPLTADQKWKMLIDILSLFESMDAVGRKMTVNGGVEGCRFPEFSLKTNKKEDEKKCIVMFEKDTHADVTLTVRKIKGQDESRITGFRLSYDKEVVRDQFPDNQVPITGFQFIPRTDPTPFYEEADPPTSKGYKIKYIPTRAGFLDVPLLGYPLFKLFAEDSDKLEFTKDYLSSWGLDDANWYKDSHTDRYRVPQGVKDFFSLIRHGDMNPPAWININNDKGKPSLFQWLSFETLEINGHLREGKLDLPNVGTIQFSRSRAVQKLKPLYDKMKAAGGCEHDKLLKDYVKMLDEAGKVEIRGDSKKLTATLINPELPTLNFSNDRFDVKISGLTAESGALDLPPLKSLMKEIDKGLNPQLHFKGVYADKIVLTDKKSGLTTTIEGANLTSLDVNWPGSFQMTGLSATKMNLDQPSEKLSLSVKGPKITSGGLTLKNDESELILGRVEAEGLNLGYSGSSLSTEKSTLTNFKIQHGKGGTTVKLDAVESKGEIAYGLDSEFTFKTSGESKLTNLKLSRTVNSAGETELAAEIGLAGKISKFSVKRGDKFAADFSDSGITEGKLSTTARLSNDPVPVLNGVKYSLDAKVSKITLDKAQLGPLTVSPSKVTNGSVLVKHEDWDLNTLPKLDVSGTLDFHVDQFSGSNESFNIPGFSVSGSVKDVVLAGDARFQFNAGDWSVEKPASKEPKPLKLSARLEDMTVTHGPNPSKKSSTKTSEMKVTSAKFFIDDVEKIDFAPSDKAAIATSGIRSLSVKGIRFEEIKAGGILWVKFPVISFLPMLMNSIGSVQNGPDMTPSVLKLGGFEMFLEDGKPITRFRDLDVQLLEVGGTSQYVKVKIPTLKIAPQGNPILDTESSQIITDIKVNHPASLQMQSVPRPLEERRSRVAPEKK